MKSEHSFFIFVYFFAIIVITMLLFSFIFSIITKRLFGNYPKKTKIYYLELFSIWLILVYLLFNIRTRINKFSKKHLSDYVIKNGENGEYNEIYMQIDEMEKFNMIIIIGFFIIFISSQQHSYKEKLSLFNEDIEIIAEAFE